MELKDFFHILKRRQGVIFYAWLIFIILGSAATFSQSLKYEASSKLLIVQNVSGSDPYTVSKSNQYLGSLFSQVVYSNSFFELVTSSNNFNIDKTYFTDNYKKQMTIWSKTISAKSNDSGIIEISIYHPNPYQAKQIALGVNDVLINQGFNYQGGTEGIKIKIIDQPLVSDYPVKPNIVFNFLAFSALGIFAGIIFLYLSPNKKTPSKKTLKQINAQNINLAQLQENPNDFYPLNNQQAQYNQPPRYNQQQQYNQQRPQQQYNQQAQYKQQTQYQQRPHPAEKVMVNTDNHEEELNNQVQGNIRNVINRF